MNKLNELFSKQDELSKKRQLDFYKNLNVNLKCNNNASNQYYTNMTNTPSIGI
jgi:hypothetical protein